MLSTPTMGKNYQQPTDKAILGEELSFSNQQVSPFAKTTFHVVNAKNSLGLAMFGRFVSVWVLIGTSDESGFWRKSQRTCVWSDLWSVYLFIHRGVWCTGRQQGIIYGKNKATSKAEIVLINPINDFQDSITRLPILGSQWHILALMEECPQISHFLNFSILGLG